MRLFVVTAIVAVMAALATSVALAGEITGSGKGGPDGNGVPGGIGNAHSECVFSGLDDAAAFNGDVQNFGHIDDPAFVEIVDSTGAAFVTAILDLGGGQFEAEIGCNPHAGGE